MSVRTTLCPPEDCLQVGSGQLQVADILRILQLTGDGQELEGPDVRALVHPAYNLAVLRDGNRLCTVENGGTAPDIHRAGGHLQRGALAALDAYLAGIGVLAGHDPLFRKKGAEKGCMVVCIIFPVIPGRMAAQILRGFSIEKIAFRLTHLCSRICRRSLPNIVSGAVPKVAVRWIPALLHTVCISVSLVCISTPQSWLQQVTRSPNR